MKKWQDFLDIGPSCVERFIGQDRVPAIAELDIQIAGASDLAGRYRVGYANCDVHTLYFVAEGQCQISTEQGQRLVGPGSVIVFPEAADFIIEIFSEPLKVGWFRLFPQQQWQSLQAAQETVQECQQSTLIYQVLCLLYYEMRDIQREAILAMLKNYLTEALQGSQLNRPENERLDKVFSRVEKSLHAPWTVAQLTESACYSAAHLQRLCQQRFGRSPMQQVIHMRITRARYLLRNTNWPVSQIAEHVGYPDPFNFSRRFKKSTGYAPAAFRKLQG